jgi:IgGFc binding protein
MHFLTSLQTMRAICTADRLTSLVVSPMESIISIAISSDNTIIWYDHWEDGFDVDSLNYAGPTTLVWGDGNADNGCPPKVVPCTDAVDVISAGQSYVIQTSVVVPRNVAVREFDAGDKIQSNLPIAVTRGAFPKAAGSVIAGAADVYDVESWGKSFRIPMGPNLPKAGLFTGSTTSAIDWFEHTSVYFMAAQDGTVVTKPDGTTVTLKQGENGWALANMGDTLVSTKPIQVHVVTGDKDTNYEMRWYSLLPTIMCTYNGSWCRISLKMY